MFLNFKILKKNFIFFTIFLMFFSFFNSKNINSRENKSAYDFSFTDIDGKNFPLSKFKGKPILIFNSASKCGFTSQYTGIQEIHENYKCIIFHMTDLPFGRGGSPLQNLISRNQ